MAAPGVTIALVLNGILILGGIVLVVALLRGPQSTGRTTPAAWHREAAALLDEVDQLVDSVENGTDREAIRRRLIPLASRIKGHAREAPASIESNTASQLHALGIDCYRIGMEHTSPIRSRQGTFLEDELAALDGRVAELRSVVANGD